MVAKVQACVPGGDDAPLADLQIGIDDANHYVVLIQQIVQCARIVGKRSARRACHDRGSDLARHLGHGDALRMAMWGKHNQCTCDVRHVAAVLQWAVEGYGGINVLGPEQRAELAAAVQKTACDLALSALTRSTGSIGVDIAMVVEEVRHLRADLESAKARAEDAITRERVCCLLVLIEYPLHFHVL